MKKSLLAVLIGSLLASTAAAEDLLQLYREARQTDPGLASARATWQATQERVPQAQAGLLPTVSVAGSASYAIVDSTVQPPSSALSKATQVNSNVSLNAS